MRDPHTSTQGAEPGHHPDSIGPAQVMVPDTMLSSFTGKQPGRSYALQFGIGVVALGALGLFGYEMTQPPTPGTVVVNTRPTDVTVAIDGKKLTGQISPVTLDGLSPEAEHVIEISRDGYKQHTERLTLKAGEVKNLPIIPLEAAVVDTGFTLDSAPTGASVFIDGKKLDQVTPVKVTDLPPGEHTVRLEHGFTHKPWEGPVAASTGQMLALPTPTLVANSPAETKKLERAAKLQALKDAKAAKAAAKHAVQKPVQLE